MDNASSAQFSHVLWVIMDHRHSHVAEERQSTRVVHVKYVSIQAVLFLCALEQHDGPPEST